VDFARTFAQAITLDVSAKAGNNFAVKPTISYYEPLIKSALNTSSVQSIKVYWLVGENSNDYNYGQYTDANSITFSKAELTATTIASKNITPATKSTTSTGNQYAWVQAYFIRDGKPTDIDISFSGAGLDGYNPSYSNTTHQNNWRLDY